MTAAHPVADIPVDRVIQLLGDDVAAIAMTVAADGTGLAAVVAPTRRRWTTAADFVGTALEEFERVAAELLPAWLPDAASIDRPDLAGMAAVRMAASAHARRAHHPPSLVVDLAVRAVTGRRDVRRELPLRTRAAHLVRLVAEGFGRPRPVLLVPLAADLTTREQRAIVAGAGWLTQHAPVGVWLVGTVPADGDRVPLISLTDVAASPPAPGPPAPSPITPSPVNPSGKPHPASAVEASLEAALAAETWASGRQWNQAYQSNTLSAPIRLDLLWSRERCVVELDGPEHCHPGHFEADRQRDVQLQLDGYAVLRFTNARIIHDVGAVVHQIGTYLRGRRRDIAEGRTPWPATSSPHPRTRL